MAHKYEVVAAGLSKTIVESSPHDPLPSERELMLTYGVSRMTVRAAIGKLIDEGRVYNVHGTGTFVGSTSIHSKTPKLTSFTEDMISRGHVPSSRVLGALRLEADKTIAAQLGIEEGAECTHLRRLRLADGEPMAIEDVYIPRSVLDLQKLNLGQSLYEQLARAGYEVYRAEQEISAVNLNEEDSGLLDLALGTAALCVERASSSRRGQLVEFARTLYRADQYNFQFAVTRDSGTK